MATPDDHPSLPGWTRYGVLVILGVGLLLVFLGSDRVERSKPPEPVSDPQRPDVPGAVPPVLGARGAISAVALKAREDLAAFGEGIVEGIARGRLDKALPKSPEEQPEVRQALLDALLSEEWSERWVALLVLHRYGSPGPRLVSRLIALTYDEAPQVKRVALDALGNLHTRNDAARAVLRSAYDDAGSRPELAAALLRAVARSEGSTEDVPRLRHALDSEHDGVRRAAAYALARLDADADEVTDLLIQALGDDDGEVRMYAAMGLSRKHEAALPVVRVLISALADPEEYVVAWSETALKHIGQAALPALQDVITAGDRTPSRSVVWILRQIGSDEAKATLTGMLTHPDPLWRARAAMQLHAMGTPVDDVLPVLLEALETGDAATRLIGIEALSRMGRAAAPARSALEALAQDEDARVRRAATNTLAGLPPEGGG